MKTSDNGVIFIKEYEQFRANPYLDQAGKPTIGYGSTFYANGQPVSMDDPPITEPQASRLMEKILSRFEDSVNGLLKVELNTNQFDAIMSLVYNIGVTNFRTSTILERLNAGLFRDAAEQFQWWRLVTDKATGKKVVSNGLVARRKKEKFIFLMAVNKKEQQSMGKLLDGYKTYIGIFFTTLGTLSGVFGWDVGLWVGAQDFVVSLVGSAIALYGYIVTNRGSDA